MCLKTLAERIRQIDIFEGCSLLLGELPTITPKTYKRQRPSISIEFVAFKKTLIHTGRGKLGTVCSAKRDVWSWFSFLTIYITVYRQLGSIRLFYAHIPFCLIPTKIYFEPSPNIANFAAAVTDSCDH